jgi:hypothetical protein
VTMTLVRNRHQSNVRSGHMPHIPADARH